MYFLKQLVVLLVYSFIFDTTYPVNFSTLSKNAWCFCLFFNKTFDHNQYRNRNFSETAYSLVFSADIVISYFLFETKINYLYVNNKEIKRINLMAY